MTQYERHPLSAEYSDLEGEAWDTFLEGFRTHGFMTTTPIVLFNEQIIDGWQRYRACKALKIQPSLREMPLNITPEDYVRLVNDERRHESAAAKAKRVADRRERVAAARVEGKSLRTIAEEEGIDQKQVQRDLETVAKSGADMSAPEKPEPSATPAKVTGKDGKSYPATAPKAGANGKHAGNGKADDDAPPTPPKRPNVVDDTGTPVPRPLEPIFASSQAFRAAQHYLRKAAAALGEVEGTPAYQLLEEKQEKASRRLYSTFCRTAAKLMEDWRPAAVCSACKGAGCEACDKRGWLASEEVAE